MSKITHIILLKGGKRMRSKRRIFAWLLAVVMVISLMPNQYMIVTKAEEASTAYSIAEALELESTKEIVVDGEVTPVEVNKVTVSLPRNCYDFETGTDYVQWDDTSATLYKVSVPKNSAVKLTYEYTGDIVGDEGDKTSHSVKIYDKQELKNVSTIVNTSDVTFGATSQSFVIPNDTDIAVTYLIVLDTDESNTTALTATSSVSYTEATEISEGDIVVEGDSRVIQYPYNDIYNNAINDYKDGYVYKFTVPDGENYSLKLKYVGESMLMGNVHAEALQASTNENGQQVLMYGNSCSIGMAQSEYSISLGVGENYIFLSSDLDEWDDVQITLKKIEDISALKDDAVVVSGVGEYAGEVTEDSYVIDANNSGKGTLYAITLQPNTGYQVSAALGFYLMTSDDLGTGYYYYGCAPYAVYNGHSEEKTYYAWVPEFYDIYGKANTLKVENITWVTDCETTEIASNVTDYNIIPGDTYVTTLSRSGDMYGNSYDSASTYYGSIYSVELPAYSKYMLRLDYVGEEYVDDYNTINSSICVMVGNYAENSMYVSNQHDTWSDQYYKTSTVALDNSTNASSQTVYLIADGLWEEGDIQITITEYPNITQLMSKAEDITGKTTYTGAVSDSNYEFVMDYTGYKGDMRGGLQKVTIPAGKTKYYNVTSGFNGVIYKEIDGELIYDSPIHNADFSVTNSSTEDAIYYIWLYTWDSLATSYEITSIQEIKYRVHSQTYGWMNWTSNGNMAGTTGQSKRLEGFEIMLVDNSISGGVRYTAHVQTQGWVDDYTNPETWTAKDGYMCGTAGEQKRIETICIDLYGDVAEQYDIYYRVSTHKFGWLGWAKNGERAGSAGFATAIEAMEIALVPEGEALNGINGSYGDKYPFLEYEQVPTISELINEATDVSEPGTYTIPITDTQYYHNNYTLNSVGSLLKVEVPAGEIRIIDDTQMYNWVEAYVYDEANVDGSIISANNGENIAIGNPSNEAKTYYVWLDEDNYSYGEGSSVTVEVTKAYMANGNAVELSLNETKAITSTKTSVGYQTSGRYMGTDITLTYMREGIAYYVDIPANSKYNLNLDYVGETTTGYYDVDYTKSMVECLIQDAECKHTQVINVSKYLDCPNYYVGGNGMNSASYLLENDSDETARYCFIVTNVENDGDVEISVNEVVSIDTLVDKAIDITKFNTYEGSYSLDMYKCNASTGEEITRGELTKITLQPKQVVQLIMSANTKACKYELVDGSLEYKDTIFSYDTMMINELDKEVTYYLWLNSGYTEIGSYTVETKECNAKLLKDMESTAKLLVEGDNKISTADAEEILVKTRYYYDQEYYWDEYNIERASVYKFEIPAQSEVTFKLVYDQAKYASGPRIYRSFDSDTYSAILWYQPDASYCETEWSISNVSNSAQTVALYYPVKSVDDCTLNISVDLYGDALKIFTWNDEMKSRLAGIIEAKPEYKDKVKVINLDCSGTDEAYISEIKKMLEDYKDETAIVVMDMDIVNKLKSEDGFATMEDIGFDISLYDNAYDYTVEMGSYNDELKFVTQEANPGGFIYDMNIAKEVLGTDDPKEVQELIGSPEKFLKVAQQMKEAGYYMTSGEDTIVNLGKYTFNEDDAKKLSASLTAGKYTTGNSSWSVGWYDDMASGKVFGFFGSPWYVYWVYQYSDIPVAICEGPIYYPWGGSFLGVASDGDNEKDTIATELLELLCCDEETIYTNNSIYVSDVNGGIVFPNNQKVVERLIADGYGMTTEYKEDTTLSNNPLPIWHNAASRIGKGEWESKCTDRKYIINVDSKKQINLTPKSETGKALMDAGFVYENFTKIADTNGNATFDATTGVLTVTDVKEVVRYIYTENGVSRELQFIACMEEDTSVTVKEDVVVDETKGETTTTYVEVDAEKGEIVGQIDEVEVKTEDENTTIVVTENKDAVGEVVKDASITVSQETISESTLDQSIEVAVSKNEAYAQAAEEKEEVQQKVEIKEIKAEFKDDSANTEVSKDLINKLQDKDMSLEISKKNDKGDVEYSWHFDRHSMKDVDKENVKPVNTKVTIHTDNDLKDYDKDKKDKIDKLTKKDDSEKPVEKSVIAFDHNGELPGKTTVTLNVGDKYEEGSYVYYYHYDDKDKDNPKLVPKGRGKVEKGYVPVRIDHCSDYVITNEVLAKAERATLSMGSEELGKNVELETGELVKLTCTVAPETAMQEVTYSSSDTRVLTVDENGNIKAVAEGTATITATVNDDSGVSVMVTITVKDPIVLVSEVTLDKSELELEGGQTVTLVAEVTPDNATDKTVTWTSSDEEVATVDATGKITALKEGTTTITVTANDEGKKSASCQVIVTKSVIEVTELKLDSTAVELEEGEDVTFTVTVLPDDATIKNVIWTSSDETVATVDKDGKVTAVKEGTATITAQSTDGSKRSASCEITVKKPIVLVSEIKLDNASLSLEEGASKAITATVKPTDATDKSLTWKSSDETVATVDATGKVTALKEGTVIITAQAADGSEVTAECKVTVSKKVVYATDVSISNSTLSLVEGETSTLTAKVAPNNATNNAVNWSSNNTSVATVDKNGKVTAIKAGVAVITATAADGSGKSASCKLTVVEPEPPAIDVSYHTHIQTLGDSQGTKKNGEMAGTSGMAKRLENIWIKVEGNDNLGIQYSTHCQTYGWMPWSCDGESNGTSGEAKRLEAIKIQLTGADADKYDVYYRVHAQSYGWLGWAKNGEPSGTAGYGKRLEGIQVVVVKKGEAAPGLKYAGVDGSSSKYGKQAYVAKTNEAIIIPGNTDAPNVMYKTHVQTFGWQKWMVNGQMSGTSGKSKRLEGINIKLTNAPYDGDIVYTTHVQKYGWKDGKPTDAKSTWKKNGEMSGTNGEAKRLEAICIDLTGEMAEHYDVYYRVHAQTFGWLGWAKNGEESGTAGYAKRLEGIQIVLVPKGGAAPADNYGGITSKNDKPFIEKK